MTGFDLACSGLSFESGDGCRFLGRTYDMFGTLDANRITCIARCMVVSDQYSNLP